LGALGICIPRTILRAKEPQVLEAYDGIVQAIQKTKKQGHAKGTFLVLKVSPRDEAYTIKFPARVV